MNSIRVWAPAPSRVALRVNGRDTPMNRAEGGWWELRVEGGADFDYQVVLDDVAAPDPRSAYQPYGIHGPSRLVDHSSFPWTDRGWQPTPLADAVIYELHIGTFTPEGTFDAAIGRLDHLVSLGVTHMELMPVSEFSGARGWGYDGVDLYAPHHAYGGPDGLKRLIGAAHARGLAAILDVVYNHLGPAGNYLDRYGPYFTDRYSTPWGPAVNLDGAGSDEVRRFFCDNALMWLRDYHFDGLRLDAVHALMDRSATHLLEELKQDVNALSQALGRPLFLIAESDLNDPRIVRCAAHGGYGIDAQWSDDFHHALHTALTREDKGYYADFRGLEHLARACEQTFVYSGGYSPYRGRRHGREHGGVPPDRFLAYMQNHDQIGNRAKGERSSHLMNTARLKIAAGLVLTSPFTPMLFQGEEWGASTPFLYFSGHEEQWLADAVTTGRCEEFRSFGWQPAEVPDPQSAGTFERSKLRWDESARAPHAELLRWHRSLIQLRRGVLRRETMMPVRAEFSAEQSWFRGDAGPFTTVCNLSAEPQTIALKRQAALLLASAYEACVAEASVSLPPESIAILRAQ